MSEKKIPIGIIGLGMVGEPLHRWFEEVCDHERGKNLFLYDTDPKKGYFDDINCAEVIFICAPTPPSPDGSCNTKIVASAVETIRNGKIIVIKSTVIPGTTQLLQFKNLDKALMFNGEYLTESQSWSDFLHPARQIIGFTPQSKKYSTLVLNLLPQANFQSPMHMDYWKFEMTATEAEVVKYASNVFGFLKVIFGNMINDYCEAIEKNFRVAVSYENVRKASFDEAKARIESTSRSIIEGEKRAEIEERIMREAASKGHKRIRINPKAFEKVSELSNSYVPEVVKKEFLSKLKYLILNKW